MGISRYQIQRVEDLLFAAARPRAGERPKKEHVADGVADVREPVGEEDDDRVDPSSLRDPRRRRLLEIDVLVGVRPAAPIQGAAALVKAPPLRRVASWRRRARRPKIFAKSRLRACRCAARRGAARTTPGADRAPRRRRPRTTSNAGRRAIARHTRRGWRRPGPRRRRPSQVLVSRKRPAGPWRPARSPQQPPGTARGSKKGGSPGAGSWPGGAYMVALLFVG